MKGIACYEHGVVLRVTTIGAKLAPVRVVLSEDYCRSDVKGLLVIDRVKSFAIVIDVETDAGMDAGVATIDASPNTFANECFSFSFRVRR